MDQIAKDRPKPHDDYQPPDALSACIAQKPDHLATGLPQCSLCKGGVYTVEDKDPGLLWQLGSDKIFHLWYDLLAKQTNRWQICDYSNDDILHKYRPILDNILPRNLFQRSNTFSLEIIPYAYFMVKIQVLYRSTPAARP